MTAYRGLRGTENADEEMDESVSISRLFDNQKIPDYRGSRGFISLNPIVKSIDIAYRLSESMG